MVTKQFQARCYSIEPTGSLFGVFVLFPSCPSELFAEPLVEALAFYNDHTTFSFAEDRQKGHPCRVHGWFCAALYLSLPWGPTFEQSRVVVFGSRTSSIQVCLQNRLAHVGTSKLNRGALARYQLHGGLTQAVSGHGNWMRIPYVEGCTHQSLVSLEAQNQIAALMALLLASTAQIWEHGQETLLYLLCCGPRQLKQQMGANDANIFLLMHRNIKGGATLFHDLFPSRSEAPLRSMSQQACCKKLKTHYDIMR